MCLASTDPGGPRRCSADARTAYHRTRHRLEELITRQAELDETANTALLEAYTAANHLSAVDRDAFLAALTPEQVNTLADALNAHTRPAVDAAFDAIASPQLADTARTVTKQLAEAAPVRNTDGQIKTCSVTPLGDGLALYRIRQGAYAVALHDGQAYCPVAVTDKASRAMNLATRIPVTSPLQPPPPGGVDDLVEQAYRANRETALELAAAAAHNRLPDRAAQNTFLQERAAAARDEVVDAAAATPLRTDVLDASARHRHRQQLQGAEEAGQRAQAVAAAAGATTDAQQLAYEQAYRNSLGEPTRGGAHIPHFTHSAPPAGMGAQEHNRMSHSGLRVYGADSAADYTAIARRGGDLKQWGINNVYDTLALTPIKTLTATHARFIDKTLSSRERQALRAYTSGKHFEAGTYLDINAALTGREPHPSPSTANTCTHLRSAFEKFSRYNTTAEPVVVVRGTSIPTWWDRSTQEYLSKAFPIGGKVMTTGITSASAKPAEAARFAGRSGRTRYTMVIRTRDGLPVKSISANAGEDEVIIPPNTALRTVAVRQNNTGTVRGTTVYLVAEDLVAEAEAHAAKSLRTAS